MAGILRGRDGTSPPILAYKIGSNFVYKQQNTISIDSERPHKIHFKVIGLIYMFVLTTYNSEKLKANCISWPENIKYDIGCIMHIIFKKQSEEEVNYEGEY